MTEKLWVRTHIDHAIFHEPLSDKNKHSDLTGVLFADADDASPTTEVDVPMTNDDVDVEMLDDAVNADAENCFLVELPVPALRVNDLLMLPQSAGILARV